MKTRPITPSDGNPTYTDLPPQRLSTKTSATLAEYREALIEVLTSTDVGELPVELLSQALNEAEALATLTPFPILFLPSLAEEKISDARNWFARQQRIREQEFTFTA